MSEAEEILDLVNDQDEIIGTIPRSEASRLVPENLGFIRAVDMFIQNDDGKLWIPTRTAHKTIAPDGLDYSMGGHVDSGETYDQTVYREAEEELNIKLDPGKLELVKKFPPAETPYFRAVYLYHTNETPDFNPDDFVSAEWLAPQELVQRLDSGVLAKSSIRETVTDIFAI
jgi:isopentenyl-diphosphate delta-isomerase